MVNFIQVLTEDELFLNGLVSSVEQSKTIIIHIHGMQGDFYTNLNTYYEDYKNKGITFLAGETRGSYITKSFSTKTQNKIIGGAYEIFEECIFDIKSWIDYAHNSGFKNIWLSSHSLSTSKISYYINETKDSRVKGMILMSPSDNIGLTKDSIGIIDHNKCFPEALELIKSSKGKQLLSHKLWGEKILCADTYFNLFNEDSASNIFHYYDTSISWKVLNEITIPVIAFSGTNDDGIFPVIDPLIAMNILKKELLSSPHFSLTVFKNAQHSFEGFEKDIIEKVSEFIKNS